MISLVYISHIFHNYREDFSCHLGSSTGCAAICWEGTGHFSLIQMYFFSLGGLCPFSYRQYLQDQNRGNKGDGEGETSLQAGHVFFVGLSLLASIAEVLWRTQGPTLCRPRDMNRDMNKTGLPEDPLTLAGTLLGRSSWVAGGHSQVLSPQPPAGARFLTSPRQRIQGLIREKYSREALLQCKSTHYKRGLCRCT